VRGNNFAIIVAITRNVPEVSEQKHRKLPSGWWLYQAVALYDS